MKEVAERQRWARNQQLAEYLGVTVMTLWRWKRNPKLNFPAAAKVNDIEFNDLDAIDEWLRSKAVAKTSKKGDTA